MLTFLLVRLRGLRGHLHGNLIAWAWLVAVLRIRALVRCFLMARYGRAAAGSNRCADRVVGIRSSLGSLNAARCKHGRKAGHRDRDRPSAAARIVAGDPETQIEAAIEAAIAADMAAIAAALEEDGE